MIIYEDLVISKAVYEKGTPDEIDEFIYELCDVNGDGHLERCDLEAVLDSISDAVFNPKNTQTALGSSKTSMKAFVSSAEFSREVDGKAGSFMSFVDFRNWCNHKPSARKYLGNLLKPPDAATPGFQVPHLLHPENLSPESLTLQKEFAWHIAGALSQSEAVQWKLVYHSAINGFSFSTFMGSVSVGGPTVLVIKDTEGHIYGGYASQPWERHSDFYGDMKSFLFQLYPQASIFRASGQNNNLQWCAANFSSDSIPNGIGFGGRANHFGLFLSANFDRGHSFACTTFNSPCLSKTNQIQPDVIECWAIMTKGIDHDKIELSKGTILERFKEDRNMLKMVGLANSSE
ncbi:TLD domain-containing protein 1 isoform X2 [Phalaenopsis equestris]|nr:TLD domain-containing protein 1 isoform X2 [Phalaenopsis equestris]